MAFLQQNLNLTKAFFVAKPKSHYGILAAKPKSHYGILAAKL